MRVTGLGVMRRVLVAVRTIGLGVARVRVLVATGLGVVRRIRVLVAIRVTGLVAETVDLLITRLVCLGTTVLAVAILDSAF